MIVVEVRAPRRCQGKYSFEGYREFYRWLEANRLGPSASRASALMGLAESGSFMAHVFGLSIACSCDKPVGYKAKELAKETGFIKTKMGSDVGYNLQELENYLERLLQLSKSTS